MPSNISMSEMKNSILVLLAVCASFGSRAQTNGRITEVASPELSDSIVLPIVNVTDEWLTTSNHLEFSTNFRDSCLTTKLEIVTMDLTDSTLNLVNQCNGSTLGIVAAQYQYPDGSLSIRSSFLIDTILTISIGEYMGDYFPEDYYEIIRDSVAVERIFNSGTLQEISKDSIRTTKRIEL